MKDLARETILARLGEVDELPTLPTVLLKMLEVMQDPNSSISQLSRLIEEDPSLTGRVLRLANSSLYAHSGGSIFSIQQAVVRLGVQVVGGISFSLKLVSSVRLRTHRLDRKRFWIHCISTGFLTRVIQQFMGKRNAEETAIPFTAGILHDIGLLVLDHHFPEFLSPLLDAGEEGMIHFLARERTQLGMSHAELGSLVAERWNLPAVLRDAIRHHHYPEEAPPEHLRVAQIVHLADFISANHGFGDSLEGFPEWMSPGAWEALNLSVEDIPRMLDLVSKEARMSPLLFELSETRGNSEKP